MPARVVLLGLDSASVTLVRRWMASGHLPHLEELRRQAAWGLLTSPPGLGDDATWASFSTCTAPGAHGRFYFRSIRPGSYEYPFVQDDHLRREPFWNALGRQGLRTAVLDVPKAPLSPQINGLHLTDWRVHGRDGVTRSVPADLAPRVIERYGDDRTDRPGTKDWLCRLDSLAEDRLETFLDHLLESIEQKTSLAMELLEQEAWDLFLLVFKEAHCAGHQCWHLVDPAHPAYRAALARRLADPLLRVYQALDGAIGRLRARLSPETSLLVFSDLDMGPNYTGEHILDDVLRSLEDRLWPRRSWSALRDGAIYTLERRVRRPLTRRPPRLALVHRYRRAFQLEHNEISGAVRLNIKGREPAGIVEPGHEAESLLADLTRELLQLVNPGTGGPVVQEVLRTARLYDGDNRELLPDLLVVWNREAPIAAARSPLLGAMRARSANFRTGNHLANGFCLAAGPFAAGRPGFHASITDLGPTVAHLLGACLDNVEGRPIPELCSR